jgi:geranylgeranyl pyrophosphate synthase
LATAPPEQNLTAQGAGRSGKPSRAGGWPALDADTNHLKFVPDSHDIRARVREQSILHVAALDHSVPLSKARIEATARELLGQLALPESYLGWTMVLVLSAFWHEQLAAVPVAQRLLLLPATEKHGADCRSNRHPSTPGCPACAIAQFQTLATSLGYQVFLAESSAGMMRYVLGDNINAVVGVATLDLLERAIDKILLAGIPCAAVPLVVTDAGVQDADWIGEMIRTPHRPGSVQTKTYVHLMRAASRMFQAENLERLAPRSRKANGRSGPLDPLNVTESLAYEFLAKGGKHSRPFITLAVHDALTGGLGTRSDGQAHVQHLSDAILRAALSIETFHKASLVHDDIEDDDEFRYGDQTLHRKYGTPTAINVGDYLIGLGYRLVSRETSALGAEVTADILDGLAQAHMKLAEGQGAELIWRDSAQKDITPADALQIYALKTAPAFEAALWTGLRLAGPLRNNAESIPQFARHLGIAFQVLNDLNDWSGDTNNKLTALGDIVGGRPTVLWALALEGLPPAARQRLMEIATRPALTSEELTQIKELYTQAGVFEKAAQLIDEHERLAQGVADRTTPSQLRELLRYLIEMVLDRQPVSLSTAAQPTASESTA